MNLLALKYFLAVAEHSSFTKASEHVFVTQPTLSRQIMDLEEELGVTLFIRGKHSVALTSPGERLVPEAVEILRRCDHLREVITSGEPASGRLTGVLRLGYQGFLDTQLMHQAMKAVSAGHPLAEFSLFRGNPPELSQALLNDKVDAVFGLQSCLPKRADLEVLKLRSNELQLAVPRSHPLAKFDSVDLRELANETFILLERKVSPLTVDYAVSLCMRHGFSPQASHYVGDAEKALMLVSAGKGICFVHTQNNVPGQRDDFQIKALKIEGVESDFDFVLAFVHSNPNPLLRVFVEELQQPLKVVP